MVHEPGLLEERMIQKKKKKAQIIAEMKKGHSYRF